MLKITCCEECRRKRRLCRCKPSIQSVVPHDANNGSREALRPQSGAVPQAATCCDCSHYEPDVGEYAVWCNLHRVTLATDYPCDQWQQNNTDA